MTAYFYMEYGGRWPDANGVGGFGRYGFDRLDPDRWSVTNLLSSGYYPSVGGDAVTTTVPPSIVPVMDVVRFSEDGTAYANANYAGSGFRIYISGPGYPEKVLYASGNPFVFEWNVFSWAYFDDPTSPHYLSPVVPNATGFSCVQNTTPSNVFTPDNGATWLYSLTYVITKSSPWEEGTWTIRSWNQTRQIDDLDNPDSPPLTFSGTSEYSFTVGGYAGLEVGPIIEVTNSGAVAYDPFVRRNLHGRSHR